MADLVAIKYKTDEKYGWTLSTDELQRRTDMKMEGHERRTDNFLSYEGHETLDLDRDALESSSFLPMLDLELPVTKRRRMLPTRFWIGGELRSRRVSLESCDHWVNIEVWIF